MLGDNRPVVSLVRALNPDTRVRWDAGTLAAEVPLTRSAPAA